MALSDYGRLVGYREDVDLNLRWWHRLAKVGYSLLVLLVLAFAGFILWDDADASNFEPKPSRVRVTQSFTAFFQAADVTTPNTVPGFLALPGELGQLDSSKQIGKLYEFSIDDWWCTPDAVRHAEAIARHLNEQLYSTSNTAETVLAAIGGDESGPRGMCWFGRDDKIDDLSSVVKYEFTNAGYAAALYDHVSTPLFWLLVAHVVLVTFYYRGVVYVACGPRRVVSLSSAKASEREEEQKQSV